MQFINLDFEGLKIIKLHSHADSRGYFTRIFSDDLFKLNIPGFASKWVQINHSYTANAGTWRGFHYQKPPFQETKVVRCIKGKVLDIVLDLRKNSNTFLKSYQIILSENENKMLYIPKGFAHGFLSLEDNSELIYLHDQFYSPDYECGIRYDDPILCLNIFPDLVSDRDKNHPLIDKTYKGI